MRSIGASPGNPGNTEAGTASTSAQPVKGIGNVPTGLQVGMMVAGR